MMKFPCIKIVLSFILLLCSGVVAEGLKTKYLPPLQKVESGASSAVLDFVEANAGSQERLKVQVAYLELPAYDEEPVEALYVTDGVTSRYYLNGQSISEGEYFAQAGNSESFVSVGYQAELTSSEINALLRGPKKVHVSEVRESLPMANYSEILDSLLITNYAHHYGYTGVGIGMFMDENDCANPGSVNMAYYQAVSCLAVGTHATAMTNVMQVTAPESKIYGMAENSFPDPSAYSPRIELGMVARGAAEGNGYGGADMLWDNYIYSNGIPVFIAAGNKNNTTSCPKCVASPGKAVNAITVGAVIPFTNEYADYSNWKNSEVRNQKPEIANYTDFSFPSRVAFTTESGAHYAGLASGTSAATAFSAATLAPVLQQHPFLKGHPEMVKALFLTAATKPIVGATLYDTDNATLAAQGLPLYRNLVFRGHSRYWRGSNTSHFINNYITFTEPNIVAGRRYRIAIAWLSPAVYVFQNKVLPQDLDLYVYQGNTLVASSLNSSSPFELVDFVAETNQDLTVKIHRYANSGIGDVKIGFNMIGGSYW